MFSNSLADVPAPPARAPTAFAIVDGCDEDEKEGWARVRGEEALELDKEPELDGVGDCNSECIFLIPIGLLDEIALPGKGARIVVSVVETACSFRLSSETNGGSGVALLWFDKGTAPLPEWKDCVHRKSARVILTLKFIF